MELGGPRAWRGDEAPRWEAGTNLLTPRPPTGAERQTRAEGEGRKAPVSCPHSGPRPPAPSHARGSLGRPSDRGQINKA